MPQDGPYENVAKQKYPRLLVMAGLNDTRVLYDESAKWVARLREVAPDGDYLLMTEMGAGHSGPKRPLRRLAGRVVRALLGA